MANGDDRSYNQGNHHMFTTLVRQAEGAQLRRSEDATTTLSSPTGIGQLRPHDLQEYLQGTE